MRYRIMTLAGIVVVGVTAALTLGPGDSSVDPAPAEALSAKQTPALAKQPPPPVKPPPKPGDPPPPQPMCSDVTATVTVFNGDLAVPPLGWADNVVFDGDGGMWVSRVLLNEVQRYDPSGAITMVVPIEGPAGLVMGPDGLLYVNQDLEGVSRAKIARFDPTDKKPEPTTFATGLPGANGLAADGDGNLYVGIVGPMTIGQVPSVVKVLPDGTIDQAWSALADFANANGVVVSGDTLYVNRWTDKNSPIEAVPLDDPAMHKKVAQLTPGLPLGGVPKVLDDLTVGADGRLYTVAYASGELLRVDPSTGTACVIANGFFTPTSVHAPEAFGDLDPARHLFVTAATGMISHVELHPN